jgi:hypothetical protein
MAKKSRGNKPAKKKVSITERPARKKSARRSKPGVRIKLKKNPKVIKRLAELGVSVIAINDKALSLFFELERQPLKPAERAILYDAAIQTLNAAILSSDDPDEWMRTARQAAGLPPENPEGERSGAGQVPVRTGSGPGQMPVRRGRDRPDGTLTTRLAASRTPARSRGTQALPRIRRARARAPRGLRRCLVAWYSFASASAARSSKLCAFWGCAMAMAVKEC